MSKKTSTSTALTTEDGWSIPEDEQKKAAVVYPLPFLSLCNKGKEIGNYLLGQDKVNIGNEFRGLITKMVRSTAQKWKAGKLTEQSYVATDKVFKDLKARKSNFEKDIKIGQEHVIWLPDHGTFVNLDITGTGTSVIPKLMKIANDGKMALFGTVLRTGKGFEWFNPTIEYHPDDVEANVPMPTPELQEKVKKIFFKFREVETVEETAKEPGTFTKKRAR